MSPRTLSRTSPRTRKSMSSEKGVCKWTRKETSQLVALIKRQLKERDPFPYSRRINLLNWHEVRVGSSSYLFRLLINLSW